MLSSRQSEAQCGVGMVLRIQDGKDAKQFIVKSIAAAVQVRSSSLSIPDEWDKYEDDLKMRTYLVIEGCWRNYSNSRGGTVGFSHDGYKLIRDETKLFSPDRSRGKKRSREGTVRSEIEYLKSSSDSEEVSEDTPCSHAAEITQEDEAQISEPEATAETGMSLVVQKFKQDQLFNSDAPTYRMGMYVMGQAMDVRLSGDWRDFKIGATDRTADARLREDNINETAFNRYDLFVLAELSIYCREDQWTQMCAKYGEKFPFEHYVHKRLEDFNYKKSLVKNYTGSDKWCRRTEWFSVKGNEVTLLMQLLRSGFGHSDICKVTMGNEKEIEHWLQTGQYVRAPRASSAAGSFFPQ